MHACICARGVCLQLLRGLIDSWRDTGGHARAGGAEYNTATATPYLAIHPVTKKYIRTFIVRFDYCFFS